MRKNDRYHGRISAEMKGRWMSEATRLGYRTLSDFIEDTMEAVHFPKEETTLERPPANSGPVPGESPPVSESYVGSNPRDEGSAIEDVQGVRAPEGLSSVESQVREPGEAAPESGSVLACTGSPDDLPAVGQQVADEHNAPPKSCPSAAKHRIGIWCKGCRKVIR